LSDYQNEDYQPTVLYGVTDAPVANPNAPNFAEGAQFMRLWRIWIFRQSLDGIRQLAEDALISNATDVSFRRAGYDD